jgi:hypothetical protein
VCRGCSLRRFGTLSMPLKLLLTQHVMVFLVERAADLEMWLRHLVLLHRTRLFLAALPRLVDFGFLFQLLLHAGGR